MEDLLHSLPAWGLVVLAGLWLFLKEVLPRINRKGRTSTPPPAAPIPPAHPAIAPPTEVAKLAAELHQERSAIFAGISRFEETMDRMFEQNRQQIALLKTIADGLDVDRRSNQTMLEILHELRSAVRVFSQVQETLLRRLEDTGRHPVPR